jgi:hypothetical protein
LTRRVTLFARDWRGSRFAAALSDTAEAVLETKRIALFARLPTHVAMKLRHEWGTRHPAFYRSSH